MMEGMGFQRMYFFEESEEESGFLGEAAFSSATASLKFYIGLNLRPYAHARNGGQPRHRRHDFVILIHSDFAQEIGFSVASDTHLLFNKSPVDFNADHAISFSS